MTETYNPYKIALSLLQSKLKENDIPIITNKQDPNLISVPEEGFEVDKLKGYLFNYQRQNHSSHRTTKSYSTYELIQCLRKSFYLRNNAPVNVTHIGLYPLSSLKAIMGHVVEKMILSMYNQTSGTKFRNDVKLKWDMDKELGVLYPFSGVIDAISYDEDIISDVKFTDSPSQEHLEQVITYGYVWEKLYKKQCVKSVEVIYVNSMLNGITTKKYIIDDDIRKSKFIEIEDRIKYYDNCLRSKVLPEAEKTKCDFCPYDGICGTTNFITGNVIKDNDDIQISNSDNKLDSGDLKEKKGVQIKMENHHRKPSTNIKILI